MVNGTGFREESLPKVHKKLLLPEFTEDTKEVENYLRGRGISLEVIQYCLDHRLLFEGKKHLGAVFVGYDIDGIPRYAAIRSTTGPYKGDASGSDKHFSFSLVDSPDDRKKHPNSRPYTVCGNE